jgi:starvation-inducible DNA-binding protein
MTPTPPPQELRDVPGHMPAADRQASVAAAEPVLIALIDLALQLKHAHWNLRGSNFIAVHELLDDVADSVRDKSDLIAERIVQLGGEARGVLRFVNEHTSLPNFPTGAHDTDHLVTAVVQSMGQISRMLREAIAEAASANDEATADIFTETLREIDLKAWFLHAHLK